MTSDSKVSDVEAREHPIAKRMREEFEAKYGDCAGVMRAVQSYFNTRTEYNEAWNSDKEQPVTEQDVDACEAEIMKAVRANQQPSAQWIAVSERLPDSGKRVLFAWANDLGNARTSIGYHANKHSLEAPGEWDPDYCDSVNDGAVYFIPEGWYEEGYEIEECARVTGVTHWQPPPQSPDTMRKG